MNWISKIWKFLINPKNTRMLIFAGLIIFGLMFLRQCNQIKSLKENIKTEQIETQRIKNNFNASQDTVTMYETANGALRGEISGYALTFNELNNKYINLFSKYKKEKNKKPEVIIKTVIKVKEVIKEIPVYVSVDSLGNTSLLFNDSIDYSNGNKRWLTGEIAYQLNYYKLPDSILQYPDSIDIYAKVFPGLSQFKFKQTISLKTGLSIDKTTNNPIIWVETKYPGVTFPTIIGAKILDDPISRKASKKFRKEIGIGLNVGYGLMFTSTGYDKGFYIGAGINYTPKWLQFGK